MAGRKRSVTIDFLADTKDARKGMKVVTKEAKTTGEKFSSMGKTVKYAMAGVATGAVVAFGKEMAQHAARMDAVDQRTDTVFGNMTGYVRGWAADSAESFGLSENGLLNLASAFGDLLIPMGFTREEAAKMATETLEAANALSEWTGGQVSVEQASEAVSKAMLGEREMLKSLGISIMEADVQQRLLEKGQKDLTGTQLQQAKATATQELIFEKSTDALDAYAEGGNEALKSQKALASQTAELKDDLAKQLQPVLQSVVGGMGDLADGGKVLMDWFQDLSPASQKAAMAIGGLAAALTLLYANPVIAGLALVAGGIIKLGQDAQKSEDRVDSLKGALEGVADVDIESTADEWLHEQLNTVPNLLENLEHLGLSYDEVFEAIRVGGARVDVLKEKMGQNAHLFDIMTFKVDGTRAEVERLSDAYHEETEAQKDRNLASRAAADALDNEQHALDELTPAMREYLGITKNTTEAVEASRDAVMSLAEEQRSAADPVFALRTATKKYDEALATLNQLQEEGKTDTDEYRDAQYDLINATADLDYAQAGLASNLDSMTAFREQAEAAGFSKDEIDDLISTIWDYNNTDIAGKTFRFAFDTPERTITTENGATLHMFDQGGVVPGPRGKPRLVVAHGGETILPTHRSAGQVAYGQGGTRGQQTIIVEIDGKVLAQALMDPMAEQIRVRTGTRR